MTRRRSSLALLALGVAAFGGPARAAPPVAAAPAVVTVGTYMNQVVSVDLKNNQFSVDFYVWFRWRGDALKPLETFELANGRITSKTVVSRKRLGDESYAAARVLATVTKFWDLRRFPLDGHQLVLEIEDGELADHAMVYQADSANSGVSPELQVPGWVVRRSGPEVAAHVYHTNYGDTSLPSGQQSSYSRYRYFVDVARPGFGRFLKVFFGLFIAVLISWCAFFVRPKESSPRVSLGVGATFAAAAVTVAINNSLPDSNAVMLADKLVMLTLGTILASVVVTIAALMLSARGKEQTQKRLDRACAILFPSVYLGLLVAIIA